jgi:hypothetical protein
MVKEESEKVEEKKELKCQMCNKPKSEGTWNPYYQSHEECLNNSGRIG